MMAWSFSIVGRVRILLLGFIWVSCPFGNGAPANDTFAPASTTPDSGFEALFVFGDSLLDPGNRRYLPPAPNQLPFPLISADHLPYGRDFPTHRPTGRFSNGLIGPDILASLIGLPFPPPYLMNKNNIMKGCSFATAGAKIESRNNPLQYPRLNFGDQVGLFGEARQLLVATLGDAQATNMISRSLFLTCLGANDYYADYVLNGLQENATLTEVLLSSYTDYLQMLYSLGARKFAVISLPPLGCIPFMQNFAENGEVCVSRLNDETKTFNSALLQILTELDGQHPDAHFVYLNSYDILIDFIMNPLSYGFLFGRRPCCSEGPKGKVPVCIEGISSVCNVASNHVFWDFAHPTQAATTLLTERYLEGSWPDVFPMNLQMLAQL